MDEGRFVFLTGRRKNLIILANGENVSPEELENELGRNDLVKEILVREHEKVIEAEIFPIRNIWKSIRLQSQSRFFRSWLTA